MLKSYVSKTINKPPKYIYIDYIFISLILVSSFIVYLHHLVPDVRVWEVLGLIIKPAETPSVQSFFYYILTKLSPLMIFSTWFFIEKRWWNISLIAPIFYLSFQIFSNLSINFINSSEELNILYSGVFVLILIWLKRKFNYHQINLSDKFKIDSENIYLLPNTKLKNSRINRIRNLIDLENLNRIQLNAIYKEFDYINRQSAFSKVDEGFESKRSSRTKTVIELFVFLNILLTPLYFNLYNLVAPGESLSILDFSIPTYGFLNLHVFLWVLCSKLLVIIPVTLWYFTNRFWWKYFLLIPFVVGVFQFLEIFQDTSQIDKYEFFKLIPIVLLITVSMIFLTNRLRKYLILMEFHEQMDFKIRTAIDNISICNTTEERVNLKKELTELIKEHKKYPPEEYLRRLKAIKGRLEELKEQEY